MMITERQVLYALVVVLAFVTGGLIAERMATEPDCVIEAVDIGPRTD
jgi:hypothetical protein